MIGYLELKRSIEATKQSIEENEINVAISKIALAAFEKEIKKYPKPKLDKDNITG